jgi:hypothetical protein
MFAGDSLPEQVCHQCIEQVNSSYNFKLQCESSDIALRRYLRNLHPQSDSYQVTVGYNYMGLLIKQECIVTVYPLLMTMTNSCYLKT